MEQLCTKFRMLKHKKWAQNRAAVKRLILLTHFLTKEHVAHSTKLEKLVDVVVLCGSQHLKQFLETAPRNDVYTSRVAVVEFVESLGTWVEESILKRLKKHPCTASWQMSVQT
jgi:hypothetical protein